MCSPNLEYQYINPSTQVALHSDCVDKCESLKSIHWNIYQGINDSSTGMAHWAPFNCMSSSQNLGFFGKNI